MYFEPMINSKIVAFKKRFEISNESDGIVFEKFVNFQILSMHQPDAFIGSDEKLNAFCVGGEDDMGIDGLAIKLNGILMKDLSELKRSLSYSRDIKVEFIFIQSKYKETFELHEFNTFASGIRDFLNDEHILPMNPKINDFLEMKDYFFCKEVSETLNWEYEPIIRVYYVSMARVEGTKHLDATATQLKNDLLCMPCKYDIKDISFINSENLNRICESNVNSFKVTLPRIDIMSLPMNDDNIRCSFCTCYAKDYVEKLLNLENGLIRKSIFDDNVRDFQGDTSVNGEIKQTLLREPDNFALFNNGITIVCSDFQDKNRKLTISNPQIVNGCQTSSVLYSFSENSGVDLKDATICVKLVSTNDHDLVNKIVRGTNKQNIVYDEAFETTKDFHKNLERYFHSVEYANCTKIYYERRSKQYENHPTITAFQRINMSIILKSFIAMFLDAPHEAHGLDGVLLQKYDGIVFMENHSFSPYYIGALSYQQLEMLLREKKFNAYYRTFKYQILFIFKQLLVDNKLNFDIGDKVDEFILPIRKALEVNAFSLFTEAISIFEKCKTIWIDAGKSVDGIKDVPEFTKVIIEQTRKSATKSEIENITNIRTGRVKNTSIDKNGYRIGFISSIPVDVFFHENANKSLINEATTKGLQFSDLKGKYVEYEIYPNPADGRLCAKNVSLIHSKMNIESR